MQAASLRHSIITCNPCISASCSLFNTAYLSLPVRVAHVGMDDLDGVGRVPALPQRGGGDGERVFPGSEGSAAAAVDSSGARRQFLLPLLTNGPSNQMRQAVCSGGVSQIPNAAAISMQGLNLFVVLSCRCWSFALPWMEGVMPSGMILLGVNEGRAEARSSPQGSQMGLDNGQAAKQV